jgi:cytochrome c-type biogenesis protein CcmH/NrfF
LGSKIQQAVSAGHSSQDIIGYLSKDATYGTQVRAALSHGYSADAIIAYLNKQ